MNSMTISSRTRSVTLKETPMPETQLDLGFPVDKTKLKTFLTQVVAIENEQARLREELRLLKEQYAADLPLRGILTAVKIVLAEEKLINHPKESMSRVHLAVLTALVQRHLLGMDQQVEELLTESMGTVNMTTGEVTA